MKRLFGALLVSSAAFLFYSYEPGACLDLRFLRKTAPAPKASVTAPAPATALPVPSAEPVRPIEASGFTDFDGFNNLNDPLYREGSKALLRKAVERDNVGYARAVKRRFRSSLLRDAPSAPPAKAAEPASPEPGGKAGSFQSFSGKNSLIKMVPSYPPGI